MTEETGVSEVVVPREPTEAMLQGACDKHTPGQPMSEDRPEECPRFATRRRIYAAMIAAANPSTILALIAASRRPGTGERGPWLQMLYELRHPDRERVGWQDNADLMRAAADEIERLAAPPAPSADSGGELREALEKIDFILTDPLPGYSGRIAKAREFIAQALRSQPSVEAWRPIETAPKDGTLILTWCVHANAEFCDDAVAEGYAGPVIAKWIDHNGGGFTWHGLAGTHTHWQPLPEPPRQITALYERTGE